jgi:hypothetical protein
VLGRREARNITDGTQNRHSADQANAGHLQQKGHILRPRNADAQLSQGSIHIRDLACQVVEGGQVVLDPQTFGQAVSSSVAMIAVGLATVLSAEVGQVVFSLALATLGTSKSSRRLLSTSMAISTILSLVGNIQISLPRHTNSPFAWPEAIAPPVLVLSTAYVLKEQVLESIERRQADEREFQVALTDWQAAISNPEDHPQWLQFYANALRDALRKTNARRQETLNQMSQDSWRIAVTRGMRADLWYEGPDQDDSLMVAHSPDTSVLIASRNGNSPKVSVAAG